MKYSKGTNPLGMPDFMKIGIELEAFNLRLKGKDGLYSGRSAKYIEDQNWHMATAMEETLVNEGGGELVSPILRDTEKDWQSVEDMCEHIQKYPRRSWRYGCCR